MLGLAVIGRSWLTLRRNAQPFLEPGPLFPQALATGIDQANLMALACPVDAHKPFNFFRQAPEITATPRHQLLLARRDAAVRPDQHLMLF